MDRKSVLFGLLSLFVSSASFAQTNASYEFERDMPVFMDKIKEDLTYPLAWGNSPIKDFKTWKSTARTKVLDCMLTSPPPAKEYNMEVEASEKRDGYTAKKIHFNISAYSRIPAYLLVPDGKGPFPAVVLLHDHGAHFSIGKEKMIRPFGVDSSVLEDADKWAVQCYEGQYAGDYLASKGYVVIAIDALFWGERGRKEGVRYDSQQAVACNFELLGRSWSGFISYEDMYTADFLASLREVDKEKIGCMGFSMGSYRAWMLAALSDRIKATGAICWINTADHEMSWKNQRNTGGSAFSMLLPGVRAYLDYPHIASIACPNAMLFFNGRQDKLFPVEGVEAAYGEMRKVWKSQNLEDKLVTKLWDTPHTCNKEMQAELVEFFDKWLK